ncbi:MAG: DUF423 domain-containing protein [Chitinophagaceae bacterium]|nr:DUF423 domain-containing protein [Chitinophagaceae bacterium]
MTSKTVFWGAVLAAVAVALGAFGAHVLKARLEEQQLATFQTAVQYHMYHALALVAIGVYKRLKPSKRLDHAVFSFYLGIGIFSGSLYLMTISHITRFDMRWLGAITPIGGLALIIGWAQVAWAASMSKKS